MLFLLWIQSAVPNSQMRSPAESCVAPGCSWPRPNVVPALQGRQSAVTLSRTLAARCTLAVASRSLMCEELRCLEEAHTPLRAAYPAVPQPGCRSGPRPAMCAHRRWPSATSTCAASGSTAPGRRSSTPPAPPGPSPHTAGGARPPLSPPGAGFAGAGSGQRGFAVQRRNDWKSRTAGGSSRM